MPPEKKNLACRLLLPGIKKSKGAGEMKFYMASYSGTDSDEMNYRRHGQEKDLYQLFPELKEVINRYPIKSIDFRLANGDRLRIYDIHKKSATLR
jgi:hypothetical protein